MTNSSVPASRITRRNAADLNPGGDYVLYWMIAARRTHYNFALQRATELARRLSKPLVILEALRCDYPWASDRLHRFVIDGMISNADRFARSQVAYHPYVELEVGHGKGLLAALAKRASAVVTDDFPAFFLPNAIAAAQREINVRFEAVDSNGLLPIHQPGREFATAHAFRRHLQKALPDHLDVFPVEDPLNIARLPGCEVPVEIAARWPAADLGALAGTAGLAGLPIDHSVPPTPTPGGEHAAAARLDDFMASRLVRYNEERNHPDRDATSGLSPYLHFGHLSIHEVFARIAAAEGWSPARIAPKTTGSRAGWWRMSAPVEAFLDEAITWRELGFNACAHNAGYDRFESLPAWAQATLDRHAGDAREYLYDVRDFEDARTHDPVWNAAQVQLVREGRIHNYMRMIWGKKILEWSATPQEAFDIMIHLNNKYALDGRDPNSYTGILWVLGKYDRPWAPERPVFGTVRYMSSANTLRKLRAREYVKRYAP